MRSNTLTRVSNNPGAVQYSSSGILNAKYRELSKRVDHIFFSGQPYMLDSWS